jgi:hypothetical protein
MWPTVTRIHVGCPVLIALLVLPLAGSARGAVSTTTPLAVPANPAPHAAPEQPVAFSHQRHVASLRLGCRTCHTNPDPGIQMTFPATSICMGCHVAIATEKPEIKKLSEYAKSDLPIPWVRVYTLLSAVSWTHRKHFQADMPCESCHGSVGKFAEMREMTAVTSMASCVSCHQSRHLSVQCVTCHAWPAR